MMKARDPLGVWNGERFQFTLNKICEIIYGKKTFVLPEELKEIANNPIERVTPDNAPAASGLRVVFDLSWGVPLEESAVKMAKYIRQGIVVVSDRDILDENGQKCVTVEVENAYEAWIALGQYAKAVFPMPTIGITGSAGKTTSTMFAEAVFNERYNTFVSGLNGRNYNTVLSIVNQWILRSGPQYNLHIQECGAETKKLVEQSARVINADAFAITNIDTTQHIANYETAENLIMDKTSFDRVRKDNTFGVINLDDEILKKYKFTSPITTFAIKDASADFVGKNIVQRGEMLEFDVVSKRETVHIKIHIVGKHNVYNALMVFALAKKFGLTNEEIQRGFLKYESVGIRQYLRKVAGRYIYMDAYNASVKSIQLAIEALEDIELPAGGRRIAIIGERTTSNEETYQINYEAGKKLARYKKVDEYIVVGEDTNRLVGRKVPVDPQFAQLYSNVLYAGARSVIADEDKLSFYNDMKVLANRLRYQTKPGDAILIKGRKELAMWSIIDMAFGTAYTKVDAVAPLNVKREIVSDKRNKGEYYPCFDGVNQTWTNNGFDNTKFILPDAIDGKYVVRIGDGMFKEQSQLRMVVFGARVRAIGDNAFYKCTNLEVLELPKRCFYIGSSAFQGCKSLVMANMLGVGHISKAAFMGCSNLKKVFLSDKCATIEPETFEGCKKLTICAPKDSYAAKYAVQNGFALEEIDAEEELAKLAQNGTRLMPAIYGLELIEVESEPKEIPVQTDEESVNLSVVVAGDIMVHDSQLAASVDEKTGLYSFDKLFFNTKRYVKAADLAIGNLETVLGPGAYTGFPVFNTPDEIAGAMVRAGFDVSASANNHSFDMKLAGVVRTRRVLEDCGLAVSGIRSEENEKAYAIVERKGVKIAIINYTYRTPSVQGVKTLNHHPLDERSEQLINTFCHETLDTDLVSVEREIISARNEGADIVLVYYHWGCEYECYANTTQKYMAYKTAQMGADVIFGSHAHVLQEISQITVNVDGAEKVVPVFYGMGNYCWGSRLPRTGRETVQNGALATLELAYDKKQGKVTAVKTGHVPLYIKADYINDRFDFNVLSLNDMTEEEVEAFDLRNTQTVEEIREKIADTLAGKIHPVTEEFSFDRVIELNADEQFSLVGTVLEEGEFERFMSDNATVASVLKSGKVNGHSKGMAGITAVRADGSELHLMVKVLNNGQNILPVVVNRNNKVIDIFRPKNLVGSAMYGMSGFSLEKSAAEAWHSMKESAKKDNIYISCASGYRSNESHLRKIVRHAELFGTKEAEKRFMPLGYTEHHLGTAIDVTNVQSGSKTSTTEEVFQWLEKNAYRFGFIFRPSKRTLHRHVRYLGNIALAKLLHEKKYSIERYLENFEECSKELKSMQAWKDNFLTEEQIQAPRSRWSKLTLRRICDIIGVEVPWEHRWIQDRIVPKITLTDLNMVPGSIMFYDRKLPNALEKSRNAIRRGAAVIITDVVLRDENGDMLPQILVDDAFAACAAVGAFIRGRYKARVVAVAELDEQRVLRDVLYHVLSDERSVLKNERSTDNRINTLDAIQRLKKSHNIFLQNVRGVYPDYASKMTDMLQPDMAVFAASSSTCHKGYGMYENYAADRCALLEKTLRRGGVVFVELNDAVLNKYTKNNKVITYSTFNKKADYYMESSKNSGNERIVTVCGKNGKREIKIPKQLGKELSYIVVACAVEEQFKSQTSTNSKRSIVEKIKRRIGR